MDRVAEFHPGERPRAAPKLSNHDLSIGYKPGVSQGVTLAEVYRNTIFLLNFCRFGLPIWLEEIMVSNAIQNSASSTPKEGGKLKDNSPLPAFVSIGTFAGSKDSVLRIRDGNPVPANTGDQGGGQN